MRSLLCPSCLNPVTGSTSFAGDYVCNFCRDNGRSSRGGCYWWNHEVVPSTSNLYFMTSHPLKLVEVSMDGSRARVTSGKGAPDYLKSYTNSFGDVVLSAAKEAALSEGIELREHDKAWI